jgi:hypothetical protein
VGAPGRHVALEHADLGRFLRQAQPRLALGQRRRRPALRFEVQGAGALGRGQGPAEPRVLGL